MNAKPLTLAMLLMGFAVCTAFVGMVYAQSVQSSGFSVFVEPAGVLGFQHGVNETITFTVVTGNLSGSACEVRLAHLEGYFVWTAENDSTVQVDTVNMEQLAARGDSGNAMRYIDSGTVLTVATGDTVTVWWFRGIVDTLSWLIMPVMGLFGFFLSGFGVFYVGNKIRQRDAFESVRACLVAIACILIGAGLIIGWLW